MSKRKSDATRGMFRQWLGSYALDEAEVAPGLDLLAAHEREIAAGAIEECIRRVVSDRSHATIRRTLRAMARARRKDTT